MKKLRKLLDELDEAKAVVAELERQLEEGEYDSIEDDPKDDPQWGRKLLMR